MRSKTVLTGKKIDAGKLDLYLEYLQDLLDEEIEANTNEGYKEKLDKSLKADKKFIKDLRKKLGEFVVEEEKEFKPLDPKLNQTYKVRRVPSKVYQATV